MSVQQNGESAVNIVGRSAQRMWCKSCQTEGDVLGFCDCADPVYVTAGERAAAAVAANPDMSDRAIAAEIGVSTPTVSKARREATVKDITVEPEQTNSSTAPPRDKPKKRVGRDGKSRKMPKPRVAKPRVAKPRAASEAQSAKAAALRDSGLGMGEIAAELGVSNRYAAVILEKVDIGSAATSGQTIGLETLRLTDQEKLARAIKQATTSLEAAFEVRVREECKRRIETLSLPQFRKEQDEARAIIKARGGFMSMADFTRISSLLHPDRVQDEGLKAMHTAAFELFRSLKVVLVKQSEFPAPLAPDVPRNYADLMEQRRQAMAARRRNKGGSNVVMH